MVVNHLGPRLFIRSLALIYLLAFTSLLFQIQGLLASGGITPIANLLKAINIPGNQFTKFIKFPTIFWFNSSDQFLITICFVAIAISLLLFLIMRVDTRKFSLLETLFLVALYVIYLSFVITGSDFMSFQWDALLLEAGFLTILYSIFRTSSFANKLIVWLFRLLIFKLMFMSGLVKLSSQDPVWTDLTALTYHYYTQPLPNPLSFFIHQMPLIFHKISCALMFVVELMMPVLIFSTAMLRNLAALSFTLLMIIVILTGNYCFFNLLTIALCLWLVDDDVIERYVPETLLKFGVRPVANANDILAAKIDEKLKSLEFLDQKLNDVLVKNIFKFIILICFVLYLSLDIYYIVVRSPIKQELRLNLMSKAQPYLRPITMFHINNPYGLFADMTTTRHEIIIQGANDEFGQLGTSAWKDYEFKWKPGDLKRMPAQVAPYQPRLDWQMWFAALSNYRQQRWFTNLCTRLLEGKPEVLKLLKHNPYPDSPPKYIRALVYDYKFNDLDTYFKTKQVWKRELKGVYLPQISLRKN